MIAQTLPVSTAARLAGLLLANSVTVSTLYWAQAMVGRMEAEFGPSLAIRLMPCAVLAGYALGVAALASLAANLTSPHGLLRHFMMSVAGLCTAAIAPTPAIALLACGAIGLGCSLTQRLLACATEISGVQGRARAIGWTVGAGLLGIIIARAGVPTASEVLGWRGVFTIGAFLTAIGGICAGTSAAAATGWQGAQSGRAAAAPPLALWRSNLVLRRAAFQQAIVFAAFNFGWAIFPRLAAAQGGSIGLPAAIVATAGAAAAVLSGQLSGTRSPDRIALTGFGLACLGALWLLSAGRIGAPYLGMAALEIGTQLALVANQARAQATAATSADRGRITAMVTTIGFAGGAIGAAFGNLV